MNAATTAKPCVIEISRGTDPLPGEPDESEIRFWLRESLTALGKTAATVSLRILDAEEMQALNGSYRDQPSPTNVLAFPDNVQDESAHQLLGDIALCSQVVLAESKQYSIPFRDRYAHILVHGLLHLLGHDHLHEGERAEMETLEGTLLARLGMGAPYKDESKDESGDESKDESKDESDDDKQMNNSE